MLSESGPENLVEIGQEIYERLKQSDALDEHDGETIWIHPDTETHAIGEGMDGLGGLLAKVKAQPEYLGQPDDDITARFFSRRIGKLGRC